MGRMRLYNTATEEWMWWEICRPSKTPWRVAWVRLRAFLRYIKRHHAPRSQFIFFDTETLLTYDNKEKRRQRCMDMRDRCLASVAKALNSMVEMQKHIN